MPDKVDLAGEKLIGVDLQNADLRGMSLFYSDLSNANLEGALLDRALLDMATFEGANLRGASLLGAEASMTNFDRADLRQTLLVGIHFWLASFKEANLEGAEIAESSFLECDGLSSAQGLESVKRLASCGFDRSTLENSITGLPESFLLRAGYVSAEIQAMRKLYSTKAGFLSCFVSHAEADLDFAEKLIADLRRHNVRCWHYKSNMQGGEKWRSQIGNAVREHDKLLLICSRRSVYRENVVDEILDAIEQERATGVQKLYPIKLDDHVLSSGFLSEAREKVVTKQWRDNWVPAVKEMHMPDFSTWKTDEIAYHAAFLSLLDSLRVPNQD